jgi:hypothetical protein
VLQIALFSQKKKIDTYSLAACTLALLFLLLILKSSDAHAGYSTCYASTTAPTSPYISAVFKLASSTNSMYDSGNAGPTIYCTTPGASGYALGTTIVASSTGCGASSVPLFAISSSSGGIAYNSHVEDPSIGRYGFHVCLSNIASSKYDVVKIASQTNNCTGYGTTLFSAPSFFTTTGNAHFGDANAYTMKRCLTLHYAEGLTVNYSSNTVGFGSFSPVTTRYATSDGLGTTTALTATSSSFYVDVNAIGNTNYVVSIQGATLTNQNSTGYTIPAIGGTPAALTAGVEQFGIQATTTCVNVSSSDCVAGIASSSIAFPYNSAGYAYAGDANTATVVGSGPSYDGSAAFGGSRFYFKLAANVAPLTPGGSYVANLTVIVTSEF